MSIWHCSVASVDWEINSMQGVEPVCHIGGSHGDAVHADDDVAFTCGCLNETLERP